MAEVISMAAQRRKRHKPRPRPGEGLFRYALQVGVAGTGEPMRHHYPMTCICAGCGKTIKRESPEGKWGHVEW